MTTLLLLALAARAGGLDAPPHGARHPCALEGLPAGALAWEGDRVWLLEGDALRARAEVDAALNPSPAKSFAECAGAAIAITSQAPYRSALTTIHLVWDGESLAAVGAPVAADPGADAVEAAWRLIDAGRFAEGLAALEAPYAHRLYAPGEPERRILEAAHRLSLARFRGGDLAGAVGVIEAADAALERGLPASGWIALRNDYGFFLLEAGRLDAARPALEAVVREDPTRSVARLNLADLLWAQGERAAASAHYDAYAAAVPEARWPERVGARLPEPCLEP